MTIASEHVLHSRQRCSRLWSSGALHCSIPDKSVPAPCCSAKHCSIMPCSYMYIPLTLALLESKLASVYSPGLKAQLASVKALYKFLNKGVCIAINPCTHEYLCVPVTTPQLHYEAPSTCSPPAAFKPLCNRRFAFKGFDLPPGAMPGIPLGPTGLTVRFSLDKLGLAPVNPEMNSALPGIDVKSGELQCPSACLAECSLS